jgi:TRAP transporter TAXI family solute receptor
VYYLVCFFKIANSGDTMKRIPTMLAGAVLSIVAAGASAQQISFATSNPGSIYHSIGTAIAKVLNESGVNATVQPATSPNQYLPLISKGEFDMGPVNLQELSYAYKGEAWFSGRANPGLRLLALHYPLRVSIFVRADSKMQNVSDLKGQRMTAGYTAQKTINPQNAAMYATADMTEADIKPVPVPSVVGGANAFMSGSSDAFMFALGAGKVREADAAVGGIRALKIIKQPDTDDKIRKHWPVGYVTLVQPGPAAGPGVKEPTWMLTYPQAIAASEKMSDQAAYNVAKVMYENAEKLGKLLPPFRSFKPKEMMVGPNGGVPYHPGAIKFYKEVGIWK